MEQTECSETSTYKIQAPGNYPEESIQPSEHGESLTSRKFEINDILQDIIILKELKNLIIALCELHNCFS
jgi:hypothetical protein